ncbi:KH domain-containing protein [Candidatus Woesearchaeota archaeon]|nr:KH domain-containing protein [Candidatus Woesearchaeota archaeon]
MIAKTVVEQMKVKDKDIAVPGEVLAEGMGFVPGFGTWRDGDVVRAQRLGLVSVDNKVVRLIPLSGAYIPKLNDRVIGKVVDVLLTGWRLEINSPYSAVLTMKDATSEFIARGADLTQFYKLDDFVVTKITNVTSQKLIDVTMKGPGLRKLQSGRIIVVNPQKVPRIIGKEGSMVMMIKEATGCNIIVGQNGWVWLEGEPEQEALVASTIRKIEELSHTSGLTDVIKEHLEKATKKKIVAKQVE